MWILERPGYLLLVLLLPVLIYYRHFWPRRGGRILLPFSLWGGERFRGPVTIRRVIVRLAAFLFWGAWILLIVALAGPTRTERERVYLSRGADIVLVVDQSASMAAQDFQPVNRFTASQAVIRRFIEQRVNDHIGLVGFSAEAALRVPPTRQYDHLLASLESMELMELGDGTAIGMGLALATLHLQGSDATRQAIILLTDGVNNAGEISPEAAAEVAGREDVRIYTIGVGSGREAAIEVRDPEDGQLYRGTIRDGYDEETLQRIAELSGGRYFSAGSPGALEAIFNAIGTAEETERRVRVEVRRYPQHRMLILIALLLLTGDLVLRRILGGYAP
ncbi:MAG: VWA domain-containing protein [Alkalispirochaeta sp.]